MTSALRQTGLILRCQWQSLRASLCESARSSKLMIVVVGGFLVAYQVLGLYFFSKGLEVIGRLPTVGDMLQGRILSLIFFLFFLMLIFSNCVLLFVGAFRNRQTSWLLALPVHPQALFAGRIAESVGFSSWGLIVLSAPILFSYGGLHGADPLFYLKSIALIVIFIALPAALAGMIVLAVARWWPTGKSGTLAILAALSALVLWKACSNVPNDIFEKDDISSVRLAMFDALRHTEIANHPLLPSAWVSDSILGWLGLLGGQPRTGFFSLLTISNSLMALLVVSLLAATLYVSAWSRVSRRSSRRTKALSLGASGSSWIPEGALRQDLALLRKDALTFLRDPSQWVQCTIVVGLLLVYILNIQNMGYDYESAHWHAVICYLNFTVCALALSTLTTRFVFPQFSMEGQRLWLLGMAPMPTERILWLKFGQAVAVTGVLTGVLMILSGHVLELPASGVAYLSAAMLLLCVGLNALSAGLGTLFPNFRENNPAKMVSGFGGTLCLVSSFILIVVLVLTIALPEILELRRVARQEATHNALQPSWFTKPIALTCVTALVATISIVVLLPASRKIKRLDFLRIP